MLGLIDSFNMEMEYMSKVAGTRLLCFFALFMVTGVLIRSTICSSTVSKCTFIHTLEDLVAAFEVYGCNIGHIYVFQIYGLAAHFIVVLIVGSYHALSLKDATANPITHIIRYLTSCCPPEVTITKILAQVFGSLVGHLAAVIVWPALMSEFESETLVEMHCIPDSTLVPVIVRLIVEFIGMVLTCVLVFNIASSSVDFFEPPAKVLLTCLLNGTGVFVTNIYLNPVVASSRMLIGCGGEDLFFHLIIYWIAPIAGAAVAVLHKVFTSCDSDVACLPSRKFQTSCLQSSKACAGLKSDFDPDLLCGRNGFHELARSCAPAPDVQMPPICVSRVEDDSGEDEVIYKCPTESDVSRGTALNCDDGQWSQRRHRRTEQSLDDTCFKEFPGSDTTSWPEGTLTSSKTCGTCNVEPISSAGKTKCINQSLCCDKWPVSNWTAEDNRCGCTEDNRCGCTEDNRCGCTEDNRCGCTEDNRCGCTEDNRCCCTEDNCCRCTETPSCSSPAATAQRPLSTSPTRKKSQPTIITQPLRDNSQTQGTDNDYEGELEPKPSFHNLKIVVSHRDPEHQLDKKPSHPESMPPPPKTSPHHVPKHQLPKSPSPSHHLKPHPKSPSRRVLKSYRAPLRDSPTNHHSIPSPKKSDSSIQFPPKRPAHHISKSHPTPQQSLHIHPPTPSQSEKLKTPRDSIEYYKRASHPSLIDLEPTPPHNDPQKTTPRDSIDHKRPSHQSHTNPHPTPSHNDPRKSTPRDSIDHKRPSHQSHTNPHPTPSHNDPDKSTPQDRNDNHTRASDDGPPSHNDPRKSTPRGSTEIYTIPSHLGPTDIHPTLLHKDPSKSTPRGPTDNHPTSSHNDPRKSTPIGSTRKTSHHGPNPYRTPSHNDPQKLTPQYTPGTPKTPCCQRSSCTGFCLPSVTQSKSFPTCQNCRRL